MVLHRKKMVLFSGPISKCESATNLLRYFIFVPFAVFFFSFSHSPRCSPVSGEYLLTNSIVISFNWSVKGLRVCWIYWRNNCKLNPSPFPNENKKKKKHTHTQQHTNTKLQWYCSLDAISHCRESTSIGCFLIDYRRNQKVQEFLSLYLWKTGY